MQNSDQWKPSKFVQTQKGLRASRESSEIGIGSRFIGDLQATVYEQLIRNHAKGVLLDLACGKVPLYEVYRDLVNTNVCVDWANTMHKSPYLDYTFDLNQGIPLEDASFDTILLTDVLEHILYPDQLWQEMARVLRPGGKVLLTTPFLYWIHEAPHDYCRYTEHKLRWFAERNALEIISLEAYGGAPEVVFDTLAKLIDRWRAMSTILFVSAKAVLRTRLGRRLSARSRSTFPLGYSMVARKP